MKAPVFGKAKKPKLAKKSKKASSPLKRFRSKFSTDSHEDKAKTIEDLLGDTPV